MDEIAALPAGEVGGVAEQVDAAASDLDQVDAQGAELVVLGAGDGLRDDAGHGEAEGLGGRGGTQCRVTHRRDDEVPGAALAKEVFEQVGGAADLEAARGGHEFTLGEDGAVR